MTLRQAGTPGACEEEGLRAEELTVGGVLRMLSAGASGSILMALDQGPLRTKELTERVPGYAPRTIYRYANKLAQLGVIERHEEPGVPSKVIHSLTQPSGRELCDLVEAYADASLSRLPDGQINSHDWGALALLADLWESGMIEALNLGARTPTELARGGHGWSFHQVSRRARLFAIGGFLAEIPSGARRRRYTLTGKTRRAMALIAGVGRWRRRHIVPAGQTGLTPAETVVLLRTALPLVLLPEHGGKSFQLEVLEVEEPIRFRVEAGGAVVGFASPGSLADATAQGPVKAWVDSVLDGSTEGIRADGDASLITACLSRLSTTIWARPAEGRSAPAAAEAVAGGGRGPQFGEG